MNLPGIDIVFWGNEGFSYGVSINIGAHVAGAMAAAWIITAIIGLWIVATNKDE